MCQRVVIKHVCMLTVQQYLQLHVAVLADRSSATYKITKGKKILRTPYVHIKCAFWCFFLQFYNYMLQSWRTADRLRIKLRKEKRYCECHTYILNVRSGVFFYNFTILQLHVAVLTGRISATYKITKGKKILRTPYVHIKCAFWCFLFQVIKIVTEHVFFFKFS